MDLHLFKKLNAGKSRVVHQNSRSIAPLQLHPCLAGRFIAFPMAICMKNASLAKFSLMHPLHP
jgi:hypothetical protein